MSSRQDRVTNQWEIQSIGQITNMKAVHSIDTTDFYHELRGSTVCNIAKSIRIIIRTNSSTHSTSWFYFPKNLRSVFQVKIPSINPFLEFFILFNRSTRSKRIHVTNGITLLHRKTDKEISPIRWLWKGL